MKALLRSITSLAFAVGLLAGAAQAQDSTSQCNAAPPPAPAAATFSGGAPYDGFQSMYRQAWEFVRDSYYDPAKLGNWSALEHAYDDKLSTMDDLHLALKLMTESINDKWTTYLSPSDIRQQQLAMRMAVPNSGMEVRKDRRGQYVVDVIRFGSPAYGTAIRERDIILCVNDVAVDSLAKAQVDQLLSGPSGTTVSVRARSAASGAEYAVDLNLAPTPRDVQVEARILPGNRIYLRMPTFDNDAALSDFIARFEELSAQVGTVEGLVLDLRNNLGGELPNATLFSSLFLSDGQTVTRSVLSDGSTKDTKVLAVSDIKVRRQPVNAATVMALRQVPMVVIINGSSASAAEITIGALKDNNRATVIGVTTFGKGVGYKIHPGPVGGFLSLTGYKYVTPSGFDVHERGIPPHVEVQVPSQAVSDVQLEEAQRQLDQQVQARAKQLYDAAFEQVRTRHLLLLDEHARNNWEKEWSAKYDAGDELNSMAGADRAVEQMLKSLGARFDHYFGAQPASSGLAVVDPQEVFVDQRPGGVFVIRITGFFSSNLEHQLEEALKNATSAKAIVFDLRDNIGGRTEAGVNAAAMVLRNGKINETHLREGNNTTRQIVTAADNFYSITVMRRGFNTRTPAPRPAVLVGEPVPVVVVVNEKTASAAEIFAGALQANQRALVFGHTSMGKGVGQEIVELPFGRRMWITTFEFRPGGIRHDGAGIAPDVHVSNTAAPDESVEAAVAALTK